MLEFTICSLVTILPDYLYRRYVQGKRWGKEINYFSLWYELRWGIVTCLMLTITVITLVFYYHPTTNNVTFAFRTVTILPERAGRVDEVFVANNQLVKAGDPIFSFEDSEQRTFVNAAQQRVNEAEAGLTVAQADLAAAQGNVDQALGAFEEAQEELARKEELQRRNAQVVAQAEVDELRNLVQSRQGALDAANAQLVAVDVRIKTLLPAQIAAAKADLDEAQIVLDKTVVRAGVDGRVEQLSLRVGDYISSILRPAGILVPTFEGRLRVQAGFGQLAAGVVKPGVVAEISCFSKPFTVIPMVIVAVQDVIATGQIRPSDNLLDLQTRGPPGTITVFMEPIYENGLDGVPPGSSCIANAYTSNHERLANEDLGLGEYLFLHAVDATGLVHAMILRIQTLLFPVTELVLGEH
ncbi:MAG: HlyD family secretion protein [Pseudomonadota bacterium]